MPADMKDVFDALKQALTEVHGGTISPSQATAMASLAGAMVKVLEAGELTDRVTRLESIVEEMEDRDATDTS